MKTKHMLKSQEGFTLVEIIAVLIILGILAAVAVPRYIDLEANAKQRAVDAARSELNGRENLRWAQLKIGPVSFASDAALDSEIVTGTTGGGWNRDGTRATCWRSVASGWNSGEPDRTCRRDAGSVAPLFPRPPRSRSSACLVAAQGSCCCPG